MKPYCFIDWDGVGNVLHGGLPHPGDHEYEAMGYKIRVKQDFPVNVERLIEKFDMVWLTTWEHKANEHHCVKFGWGEWPVIEWNEHTDHQSFKLDGLVEYLKLNGERPFVFIDDQVNWEIDAKKYRDWYIHEQVGVPYMLIVPNHDVGLTTEETDTALKFAEENVQ